MHTYELLRTKTESVVSAVKDGNDDLANEIFNKEVLPLLEEPSLKSDQKLRLFLYELDEYFNHPTAKMLGATDAASILRSYSEYISK